MELLFAAVNLAVMPFWFLVIFLPGWGVTRRAASSYGVLLPLPIAYAVLLVPKLPDVVPVLLSPTLEAIASALGTPEGALLGWVHFLAFDLFVGRWVYLDSRERRVPWWVSSPILLLSLMFGPLGLLTYLLVRSLHRPPPPGSDR